MPNAKPPSIIFGVSFASFPVADTSAKVVSTNSSFFSLSEFG